jgi:glycolate oxidase
MSLNEDYRSDHSHILGITPIEVVCPTTADEVKACLEKAKENRWDVVVRGAGTGMTGGAVPISKALVISMEKLNAILDIDIPNRVAVVQPGVITGYLQAEVEKQGLFYPPDPASLVICTLGGNVAENAGGPRALKYGVTRDYVLGLKGFWVDGTPFSLGGKQHKNVAGYDLISLLVGSEGTLGIITEITLKLIPLPLHSCDIQAVFKTMAEALHTLANLYTHGIFPSAAEFMDRSCLEAASLYLNKPLDTQDYRLLCQVDGFSEEDVHIQAERLLSYCKKNGALEVEIAKTPAEKSKLWEVRRCLSLALKANSLNKTSHDVVVPPASIGHFLSMLTSWSNESVQLLGYGHLGDGNIHVNILNVGLDKAEWEKIEPLLSQNVLELAVNMGGSITGEHGIGLTKKPYLHLMADSRVMELYRSIKAVFDPENRLNPGKIIN